MPDSAFVLVQRVGQAELAPFKLGDDLFQLGERLLERWRLFFYFFLGQFGETFFSAQVPALRAGGWFDCVDGAEDRAFGKTGSELLAWLKLLGVGDQSVRLFVGR